MRKTFGIIGMTCGLLLGGFVGNFEFSPVSSVHAATTVKTYKVQKGDTLYGISKKNNVTVSNLMKWNNLKTTNIRIGQILKISTTVPSNPTPQPVPTPPVKEEPYLPGKPKTTKVKGIYMSGNSAGLDSKFNNLVQLIDDTELNAVVIDVKGDSGNVTFDSNVALVNKYGSDKNPLIKNINQRMKKLESKDIYTIARIVTFKDPYIAKSRQEFAMKKKDGKLYLDNGVPWVDPYKKIYWDYVISIAKEAAEKGFDEIQFDYVRFPTNGKYVDQVVKFDNPSKKSKSQNIQEFLLYAKKELQPYGVKISADIFGIATSDKSDSGIGHHWETLTQAVDYMSPMMYPSHYAKGSYGIKNPDASPYETIKRGLTPAINRESVLRKQGKHVAIIRPWFQDFTDKRFKGYTVYGPKQINDQIRAAKELGVEEFLLWNPQNIYNEKAFKK